MADLSPEDLLAAQNLASYAAYAEMCAKRKRTPLSYHDAKRRGFRPDRAAEILARKPVEVRVDADVSRGDRICAQIAFWRQIPAIGPLACNKLADELDAVSDRLEGLVPA